MELILIVLLFWLIAPIPLLILWLVARKKNQKLRQLVQRLYLQQGVSPDELRQAGVQLPAPDVQQAVLPPPSAVLPPMIGTVPQPAAPVTDGLLNDAAARAAKIAEAEITGTSVSAESIAWEIAAERQARIESAEAIPESAADSVQAVSEETAETAEAIPEPAADSVQAVSGETAETAEAIPEPAAESVQYAGEETAEPETGQDKTVFVRKPETAAPVPVTPPDDRVPQPAYAAAASVPNRISAITLMLSVGVLLVIIAGLIFVRSAWGSLSDGGRLATLAAGSVLFFGTAALAHRIWKLERTGMAFFTLGAAFLPISVWAAGYLGLLGDGLSGAGNPWLIGIAFASFAVISLIAVKLYRQKSWGIAFLCGLTVSYLCIAEALTLHRESSAAPFLIAATVYALLLIFGARPLSVRIPQEIGSVLEPVAVAVSILAAITAFCFAAGSCVSLLAENSSGSWLYAVPAFLAAFVFFSPVFTERLRNSTVLPVSLLAAPAFTALLIPVFRSVFCYEKGEFTISADSTYIALILMICALLWLILRLTNSLPDETQTGFLFGAGVLEISAIVLQLFDLSHRPVHIALTMLAAGAVLLVFWLLILRKKEYEKYTAQHYLIGGKVWMLCMIGAFAADSAFSADRASQHIGIMLSALCFLPGFALLLLLKKHRTGFSDLLLTVSPAVPLLHLVSLEQLPQRAPWQWCGLVLLAGLVLLYLAAAFAKDTAKPHQYIFAVLTPLLLVTSVVFVSEGLLEKVFVTKLLICWSLLSLALGAVAYLTVRRQFHGVRQVVFALTVVPPLIASSFVRIFHPNQWNILWQLICAAAAFCVWRMFANRGFRLTAAASFGAGLFLLAEATGVAVYNYVYDGRMNFTVLMLASVWILLLCLPALAVSRRSLFFVGGNSVTAVMQIAAPAAALFLSCLLVFMEQEKWESFFFVYVFALCVLAWFTTKKSQVILPGVCVLALVFTLEALRSHSFGNSDGAVALTILLFSGLTILFPYLGVVLREAEEEPRMQRRSFLLTGLGALMPSWLIAAALCGTRLGNYSHAQQKWMYFFVPVMVSGYLLHFLLFEKNENARKLLMTAAAALGMVAFWMQPFADVSDTWLEGKLHLVPLLAFGIVVRYLYGREIGGKFLFGIGLYTILRLAAAAVISEEGADLLTLLVTAFAMFLVSFFIRQKKWFVLGGASLALTAVYMHMKLTEGRQWWLYLLLAGLVLIVVAGSNEMLKQRGESLKSRAGRLWNDWEW